MNYIIKKQLKKYKTLYLFLIPAVVIALLFSYLPMLGLIMAFFDNIKLLRFDPITAIFVKGEFVWFQHFVTIFSDGEIARIIGNTLIISLMKIIILFPLPVFLAVLVAEVKNKAFSTFVQSMVFLPHFLSWVAIVGIFKNLLAYDGGAVNQFLSFITFHEVKIDWFGTDSLFRGLVVALNGWKEIGYSSIVYIAAILGIDSSLYEAARLDGATKFQQMVKVTIPMILPTIITMLIIRLGYLMEAGFDQIYTMITGPTRPSGEIIGTYVYRISFQDGTNYGLSTAIGLFNGLIALVLIVSANAISKKVTQEGIW